MAILCFDFDGTLADSLSLEEQYYLPAFHRRGIHIFETIEDLKDACRLNYYDFCAEKGISEEILEEILAGFQATLKEKNIVEPLFPGVVEMLTALMEKHTVYIVSSNDSGFIRDRMAAENLTNFAGIIGWKEAKSKEEALSRLVKKYGKNDFYYIGDSVGDIREALAVGIHHIYGVGYGWGIGEDLLAAGAHRLFDDVSSLAEVLTKL